MYLAVLFVYLVVVTGVARVFRRREGYFSTVTVFGVGCFVYYLAIPAELALFGIVRFPVSGTEVVLDSTYQVLIGLLGLGAFVGFAAGFAASGFRLVRNKAADDDTSRTGRAESPLALVILAVLSLLVIALKYRSELLAAHTYVGNYTTNYSSPVYAFLQRIALFSVAGVSGGMAADRRGRALGWWLVPAFALCAWGVYSSNKDPILLAMLAAGAAYVGRRSRRPRWFVAIWIVALGGSAAGPIAFSQFRAGRPVSVYEAATRWGIFRQSDPAGPMSTLAAVVSRPSPFRLGETYAQAAVLWIPHSLWPNRPLDLAEDYARNQIKDWSPGRGLGYSLLAESYLNFGWLGSLIQYFLIGLVWGLFWSRVQSHVGLSERSLVGLYGTVGFYLLIIMHRGATSSLVTPLVQFGVPLFLCGYIVTLFRAIGRRGQSVLPGQPTLGVLPAKQVGSSAQ